MDDDVKGPEGGGGRGNGAGLVERGEVADDDLSRAGHPRASLFGALVIARVDHDSVPGADQVEGRLPPDPVGRARNEDGAHVVGPGLVR